MIDHTFQSGFVSIVGRPNAGKSTLMNRLIGEKLSIVTPKPQTTRMNIKGILNLTNAQLVFLDAPGFLEPRYELHERMLSYIKDSLKNSDVILYLIDASVNEVADLPFPLPKKNVICVLNKSDLCEEAVLSDKILLSQETFPKVITISARNDTDFERLIQVILELLPQMPPIYDSDDLSDMPMRFFAQEIIREKIFLLYEQEIPYSSTVVVEKWTEEAERDVIVANIWIERDSQKSIIIGRQGKMIGMVRQQAELDIAKLTGKRAVLNLWVKVKQDWRKKRGSLREFGYL